VGNSRITRKLGFNGRATVKYKRGPNDEWCGTTSVASWKLIRSVFKLTAADLAEIFRTSHRTMLYCFAGKNMNISIEKFRKLSDGATLLPDSGLAVSRRTVMQRKLAGGKTLFQGFKDGGAVKATKDLINILRIDAKKEACYP
jgi:hypothetical protein